MKNSDLNERFLHKLHDRASKRADLVNIVAERLDIEKESAYRRLTGRVNFTIKEMGELATLFNISIDSLIFNERDYLWLPVLLESPMKLKNLNSFADFLISRLSRVRQIMQNPASSASIYNILPIEFFIYYPTLTKFMFFKWGHYFVDDEAFLNFSQWQLPKEFSDIKAEISGSVNYNDVFYIWDNCLVMTLAEEINNFHRMHVITSEERSVLITELTDLLVSLERWLNGTAPYHEMAPIGSTEFYVSTINMGITCSCIWSETAQYILMFTNFSAAIPSENQENIILIRNWLDSLRNVSILISGSGRLQRRLFFEKQHNILKSSID